MNIYTYKFIKIVKISNLLLNPAYTRTPPRITRSQFTTTLPSFERSITIVRQGGREARGKRRSDAAEKPRQSSLGVFLYRDRNPSTNY